MHRFILLVLVALLTACSAEQTELLQAETDQSFTVQTKFDGEGLVLDNGFSQQHEGEITLGEFSPRIPTIGGGGGGGAGGHGNSPVFKAQPPSMFLVSSSSQEHKVEDLKVGQQGETVKVKIVAETAAGEVVVYPESGEPMIVTEPTEINEEIILPPGTSALRAIAEVVQESGGPGLSGIINDSTEFSEPGELLDDFGPEIPFGLGFKTLVVRGTTGITGTGSNIRKVNPGPIACIPGKQCNPKPKPKPIPPADLCLAVGLYFENDATPEFDHKVDLFPTAAPAMDALEEGILMPLINIEGCDYDGIFPHASNQHGMQIIRNDGKNPAGPYDMFSSLAAKEWNPKLGIFEAAMDLQLGPDSLGNNLNEGNLPAGQEFPGGDLKVADIAVNSANRIGEVVIVLGSANPSKPFGGYVTSSLANDDQNGDGIHEYSYAPNLQPSIGQQLLAKTTQVEGLFLDMEDAEGDRVEVLLASGDHDSSGPGGTSVHDCSGTAAEIGMDALLVGDNLDAADNSVWPHVKYTRITRDFFRKSDGSAYETAYHACFFSTPSKSARLYMSDFTVATDRNTQAPLYLFGVSRAGDVFFNNSQAPSGSVQGGVAFRYDEDQGQYGEFWEMSQTELDSLGLNNFLAATSDVSNPPVDVRFKRNVLKDVIKKSGFTAPNVADALLVVTFRNSGPMAWEYRDNGPQPFKQILGSAPDARASHAAPLSVMLHDPSTVSSGLPPDLTQSSQWTINQAVMQSTPDDLVSSLPGGADPNTLVEIASGTYAADLTHLQHDDLRLEAFTVMQMAIIRDHSNPDKPYKPLMFATCADDDELCASHMKSRLDGYINQ